MSTATSPQPRIHVGRNIKHFRSRAGMEPETLAENLGEGWTSQKIAGIENSETVDADILELIAKALNVPAETIENYEPESSIVNICNNSTEGPNSSINATAGIVGSPNLTINNESPNFTELLKNIIAGHEANKILYERIIKEKEEMIAILMSSSK